MKMSKEQTRTESIMSKQAMRKTHGGSGVNAWVFSNKRASTNLNGGVKCEHSGNNPEPRQGPIDTNWLP